MAAVVYSRKTGDGITGKIEFVQLSPAFPSYVARLGIVKEVYDADETYTYTVFDCFEYKSFGIVTAAQRWLDAMLDTPLSFYLLRRA